jgi:hypothetical protein
MKMAAQCHRQAFFTNLDAEPVLPSRTNRDGSQYLKQKSDDGDSQ